MICFVQVLAGIKRSLLLVISALLTCTQAFPRQVVQYNLNSHNSLSSDHVYRTFIDDLGYLWIGTDNGVVRYNGYTAEHYNISNGMGDADVWDFFQDSKGRIWLSCISSEIGYMYNGRYYKANTPDTNDFLYYPKYIRENEDGITFLTTFDNKIYIGREKDGEVATTPLARYAPESNYFIAPGGDVYCRRNDTLYSVVPAGGGYVLNEKCLLSGYLNFQLLGRVLLPAPGYTVKEIKISNIETCRQSTVVLPGWETTYTQYECNNEYYIITDKSVSTLGQLGNKLNSQPLTAYLPATQLTNNQVTYIEPDNLWNNCISTTKSGVFLSYDTTAFVKVNSGLVKFKYLGNDKSGRQFWWNKESRTLAMMDSREQVVYKQFGDVEHIERVLEYSDDKMLLFSRNSIELLDKQSMNVSPLFTHLKYFVCYNLADPAMSQELQPYNGKNNEPGAQCGMYGRDSAILCITRGNGYVSYVQRDDTLVKTILAKGRFKDMMYIPLYKSYIAYGDNNIVIQTQDTLLQVGRSALNAAGIAKIEQIICDSACRNLFIKDYNRLYSYNFKKKRFTRLLNKYKLGGAVIHLWGSTLVAAGKFGVLFAVIQENGEVRTVAVYPNTKKLLYNSVQDLSLNRENIFINTGNGLYKLDTSVHANTTAGTPYRFVLKQDNYSRNINPGDTIRLQRSKRVLQFDVIHPAGAGNLRFATWIQGTDNKWNELNSNELHLPWIQAGTYYHIFLKAYDDLWESPDMSLVVYLPPTFWQTTTGKWLLWGGVIVSLLSLIAFTVYYTRLTVSRIHLKRNQLLSLKLKLAYAQISPHFIFNTLNTGLYFIKENKNKEAYSHISSFSQLLRAYIKSTRKKYVTLEEEIENLTNYIDLQQYRFEGLFDYRVIVGNDINTSATLIPSMLLQPFVENAINHGLVHKEGKGMLLIEFFSNSAKNEITCRIDDNGIGRKKSAEINRNNQGKRESYGGDLVSDLVKLINSDNEVQVSVEYKDKPEPGTGTIVVIVIKMLSP